MKKKSKNKKEMKKSIKKFSQRALVATLASSIVMTPTLSANAATYTKAEQAVEKEMSLQNTRSEASVSILDSEGWLESANVEWSPVDGATGYNVYYKLANASDSEYKQLDDQLIRRYASYFRADALGLAEGDYVIKIVPIINSKEAASSAAITKTLSVKANTREGFAFSKQSPMRTGSGGYNDDGTVPADAKIIYVTADNANSVTADVITNAKGTKNTCTGLTNILAARQKGYDKTPLIIRMVGEVKASDVKGLNGTGYLQLKGCYKVTLEGVGEDATVYGWGILVRGAHDVEIRNLGVMMFPDDAISLDTDNENIWVHNNDIFYGAAGHDADQVKGDGSCDVKLSDYVTVSYNHFHDSGKSSLCGMSDTQDFHVTYHHNWFDHSDSRHPRIRVGTVHVYNNYFDGNAKYGVGVTKGSSAFVEANYFRDCKHPMLSSLQGSDIKEDAKGGFSGEAGGMIKAYNNKIEDAASLIYANENPTQFDAYLAKSRDEAVPNTYKTLSGGTTYNNFDTNSSMYSYNCDSAENVKDNVTTYAGRVNGGDFTWNFTDADDADHSVNQALMSKIRSYESDLASIGGNSVVDGNQGSKEDQESKGDQGAKDNQGAKEDKGSKDDQESKDNTDDKKDSNSSADVEIGSLGSTGMHTSLANVEDSQFTGAIYVSPNGAAGNDGTYNNPLDLATAFERVASGKSSSILLESGTYKFDKQITINSNGTADGYNILKASKGANVVFDFSGESYNTSDTSKNDRGIQLNGNYWYMGNIKIKGAADNGMMLSGSHNIIERCIFDGNRDSGLQISRNSSSVTNFKDFPSNNYVVNCTSRNNCDPATYENADGFAAKLTCGDGNVFDGCLSYNNSDDGWDLYAKTETGSIGVVTIRNCISMRNGKTEDGNTKSSCDGNGFKLGGSGVPTPHKIINCLSIENLHHGFTDNDNPAALQLENCTAFNNNQGGSKNNFSLYRCKDAEVLNSISYTSNGTSDKLQNLSADHTIYTNSNKWYKVTTGQAVDTSVSTQRGEAISKGTSASDFINSSVPAVGTNFDELWRNEDGSLNTKGVALISESSAFGTFSTDGGVIGARFSDDNKVEELGIKLKAGDDTSSKTGDDKSPKTGDDTSSRSGDSSSTNPDDQTQTTIEHNFTKDGKNDTFFTITGSISNSKDAVEYKNLTLKQCLKMESSTSVTFVTTKPSTLTLVFNLDFNGNILIDGKKYKVNNGIANINLEVGSHNIKKSNVCNLYYIGLE